MNALPLWKLNGNTFDPDHNPPPKHSRSPNRTGLIIADIDPSMNLNKYSCFLDLFTGELESNSGYLTVIAGINIYIYNRDCSIIIILYS